MKFYQKSKITKKFAFFSHSSYNKSRNFIIYIFYIMKNIVKAGLATVVATQATLASAAINFGTEASVDGALKGSAQTADQTIQDLIGNAIAFLYILAVVYALWGGFNILTAGGDEEKVKKGKTVLIQAGIGLVVIFLASSIVRWILNGIFGGVA